MAGGGGNKKRIQYCSDSSGAIFYLWALQSHSGRSLIDPTGHCHYSDGFFKYIYHVGWAINLHSIKNSGLILGGQNLSNRQTVFFLLVDPRDKEHEDLDTIDLEAPRLTYGVLGRRQTWSKKKDLRFYQTLSDAIILHETLPVFYIQLVVRMETGEVISEKVYASPRPPPMISLKYYSMKELCSEVARQLEGEVAQRPDGEVVQQFKSSQSSQPNSNPDHDRTVKPVVCRDANHERSMLHEVDIDFKI